MEEITSTQKDIPTSHFGPATPFLGASSVELLCRLNWGEPSVRPSCSEARGAGLDASDAALPAAWRALLCLCATCCDGFTLRPGLPNVSLDWAQGPCVPAGGTHLVKEKKNTPQKIGGGCAWCGEAIRPGRMITKSQSFGCWASCCCHLVSLGSKGSTESQVARLSTIQ